MKRFILFLTFFCTLQYGIGQNDCYLGIGGEDNKTITTYFELNDNQKEKLKNLSAELKFRNEPFLIRMDRLLERHKESSPEELLKMSYTYKTYMDSLDNNMRIVDQKLIATFNNEQYNRYVTLCNYAQRLPIYAKRPLNE